MQNLSGPWTRFMDMHSGGGLKTGFEYIYIQWPEKKAKEIFQQLFNRDPDHITCYCCGQDFSIDESEDLYQATGYVRHCEYENGKYIEKADRYHKELIPLEEYMKTPSVKFIFKDDYTL